MSDDPLDIQQAPDGNYVGENDLLIFTCDCDGHVYLTPKVRGPLAFDRVLASIIAGYERLLKVSPAARAAEIEHDIGQVVREAWTILRPPHSTLH